MAKPVRGAPGDVRLGCRIRRGDLFRGREVLLNGSGTEFMEPARADESAAGPICRRCGCVHLFAGKDIKLYRADE
ncbi:hypothetical protein [Streptomyces sp. NPDC050388]|uniref:hypothetical protein n=1 Tax=Streptomyces sp. NPDC050388 TaxID=3155781 RepID=UPI0034136323